MNQAIAEAQNAALEGNVPIGAVLVKDNQVIAKAHNGEHPLAHAEIIALTKVERHLLKDCELYVTLEPCIMCCGAIAWSQVKRVYFGAYDLKGGAVEHGPKAFNYTLYKPEVVGGIEETRCAELLKKYFELKR